MMKQFYSEIGGNYDEVLARMSMERIVIKFVKKFLEDNTFNELSKGIDLLDFDLTYRSVHTLKGICLNLGFDNLANYCSILNEYLRDHKHDIDSNAIRMYEDIKNEYLNIIVKIKELII